MEMSDLKDFRIINSTYLYLKSSSKIQHMDFSHQNTHLPKVVWGPSPILGWDHRFDLRHENRQVRHLSKAVMLQQQQQQQEEEEQQQQQEEQQQQ